jgi:TetR/AcrR family transcriptional regulator, mexJK operon transcriptional repressor
MRRRKPDDYEERRQQIIDGALKVFSTKGFEQATNKEIAEAAGIGSPGLIYHYFADKGDLLRKVIEQRMPLLQLVAHPEELMPLPPAEALTRFGRAYLKVLENPASMAVLRVVLGEAIRRPELAKLFTEIGPNRAFRLLAVYLMEQMERGVLRRTDPAAAVRCFMGPLFLYVLSREVLQMPDSLELEPETVLATTVDVFLHGMQADPRSGNR